MKGVITRVCDEGCDDCEDDDNCDVEVEVGAADKAKADDPKKVTVINNIELNDIKPNFLFL